LRVGCFKDAAHLGDTIAVDVAVGDVNGLDAGVGLENV